MFILFGYRRRSNGRGVVLRECARCGRVGPHVLVTTTTWLTLFFIPIVPLPRRHRLVCRQCQRKTSIRGEQRAAVEAAIAGASAPVMAYGGVGTAANTESLSGVATAIGVDPTVSPAPYGSVGAGAVLPRFDVGPTLSPAGPVPKVPSTMPADQGGDRRPAVTALDVVSHSAPGWYPDPEGDEGSRWYWDGAKWASRARWTGTDWEPV
jgi:hypothetical protein